jgi:hypothetical protein
MKLRKIILAGVAAILFWQINSFCQSNAPEMSPEIADMLSDAPSPPKGFATPLDYVKSFTNAADVERAYRSGKISKGEAMLAEEPLDKELRSKASLNFYGKVIDQDGQPVAEANVQGNAAGFDMQDLQHTKTDADGLFHFLGLHGTTLEILPQKAGYDYGYDSDTKRPSKCPTNYVPDPSKPLVFTMWKLHEPEPMEHSRLHGFIPYDGTIIRFDSLSGKQDTNGDFSVSVPRDPYDIDYHKRFNWSVTMELANGGFQVTTNLHPYEAPAEGYQSKITYEFPTNAPDWTKVMTGLLYFKSKGGQVYGRMRFEIVANYQPPPIGVSFFSAEIYANPGGSRNLEFDPLKQIR